MTDAQILQSLLSVYEAVVRFNKDHVFDITLFYLKDLIAEFRRRIELEDDRS